MLSMLITHLYGRKNGLEAFQLWDVLYLQATEYKKFQVFSIKE
jgi:hypothetical protein